MSGQTGQTSPSIIDLSLELASDLPCWWPGLKPFTATPSMEIGRDGGVAFNRSLVVEEHMGTHMDAPAHICDETGRLPICEQTVSDLPLDSLVGQARVIDVRHLRGDEPGSSPLVEAAELERFETEDGPVVAGDAVLLWSGWSDAHYRARPEGAGYADDPLAGKAPGWPAPSVGLIAALAERRVCLIGVDVPSIGATHDLLTSHRAALSVGITPIEGLTNLGSIHGREAFFLFLPLPARGGSGSPGRATALLSPTGGSHA